MPPDEGPRSRSRPRDRSGEGRRRTGDGASTTDRGVQHEARALAVPARYDIFRRIAGATGPLTVAELTAGTGLHHNAVRQHLAQLVEARLVTQETEPPGRRGRPRLRYHLAPGVDSRWTTVGPYERLSRLLLEMLQTGDSAFEVGHRAGLREPIGDDRVAAPLDVLVDRMAGHGFAPVATRTGDRATIVLDACPFERAALADPATICQLHLGLAHGVADRVGGLVVDELVPRDPRVAGCELRGRLTD